MKYEELAIWQILFLGSEASKYSTEDEIEHALKALNIAANLSGNAKEVLKQLVRTGPVWDGDVVSKSGRDECLNHRIINKILVGGEQGYQAVNYFGYSVFKIVQNIEEQTKLTQ